MADSSFEFSGKTVDDAVAEGLAKLGVSRSDVAVEVLSKGSRGIFGIGSEDARVRITIDPERESAHTETQAPAEVAEPESPVDEPVITGELDEAVALVAAQTATDEDQAAVEDADDDTTTSSAQQRETEAAPVDVSPAYSDEELASMAAEMLGEIVRLMGLEANIVTSWQEPDDNEGSPYLLLDIEGEDLGVLIGRRGETLASLQYLVRLMVNQRIKQWRNIVVDVEKYKERRVEQLNQLALRMADQVAESGRSVALEPMPPNERRLVHLALRDHALVYTQSSGESDRRKVNIVPRDTA